MQRQYVEYLSMQLHQHDIPFLRPAEVGKDNV